MGIKRRKNKIQNYLLWKTCIWPLVVPGILEGEDWNHTEPSHGEICFSWMFCQNTCMTTVLHLCSFCDRSPSISHRPNKPNLNHGVPQWKANIYQLAKGESHLLYKKWTRTPAGRFMLVCICCFLYVMTINLSLLWNGPCNCKQAQQP